MPTKNTLKRGQIYYIHEGSSPSVGSEEWSNRPGLIVSNDPMNATAGHIQIVYLTTSKRKRYSPTHIFVQSGSKRAMALCEQIHTVDISRVGEYIGTVSPNDMDDIDGALLFSLGINHGKTPAGIFHKWEKYIHEYGYPSEDETTNDTVAKLRNELAVMQKQRDAYKLLFEAHSMSDEK